MKNILSLEKPSKLASDIDEDEESRRIIYEFVHDRLRAIRQELVIQQVDDEIRQEIFEYATFFYITSAFKLSNLEYKCFDPRDNKSHIHICLNQLLVIYDKKDYIDSSSYQSTSQHFERRCLIEATSLIFNMESLCELNRYQKLPAEVKRHRLVKDAIEICTYFINNNYYAILKKSTGLNIILFSALSIFIPLIQAEYLTRLSKGMASPNPLGCPLPALAKVLFPFEYTRQSCPLTARLCDALNLHLKERTVLFSRQISISSSEAARLMPRKLWGMIEVREWYKMVNELFEQTDQCNDSWDQP